MAIRKLYVNPSQGVFAVSKWEKLRSPVGSELKLG